MRGALAFLIVIVIVAVAGCDETIPREEGAEAVFFGEVQPILNRECVSCHRIGGIAPSFETYEAAAPWAPLMKPYVQQRIMPPWGPDNSGSCNTWKDARWLSDEEIATVSAWADGGAKAGDPARLEEPPPPASGIAAPDATIEMAAEYTPKDGSADDYRCFVVDGVETESYLTAFHVVPGELRVAHHVILFAVDSAGEAQALALDAADPGEGYECVGGTKVSDARWTAAWAPGGGPTYLPAGTGIKLEAGRKMILQMHYNTGVAGPLPDRTRVDFELAPSVAKEGQIYLLSNSTFTLPPNTPEVTAEASVTIPATITVHSMGSHMHKLGRKQYVSWTRAGESTCFADVPRFDFNWQSMDFLEQPVTLQAGDRVNLTCTWDTTGVDAPTTFGEETENEMCIALFYVTPGTF